MEDLVDASTSEDTVVAETTETETTEQDPLKTELEKVQKSGKTEFEKAQFSLKKNAERVRELGGDPNAILGIDVEKEIIESNDEDDQPITRGEFKKLMVQTATKTALQLADEIKDETERELVKYYLENRIAPSGNPQEDLRDAKRIANSVKNEQIVQEVARKTAPKTHSNSSGTPARYEEEIVYTPDEQAMMRPPFNMTSKQVLDARVGKNFTFKK